MWRISAGLMLLYAINLAAIAVNYSEPGPLWLNQAISMALGGFFFGEVGCVVLWFTLSSLRLAKKWTIFLVSIPQIAFLLEWWGPEGHRNPIEFLGLVLASFGILSITIIALRLSDRDFRMEKKTKEPQQGGRCGVTIAQSLFATGIVAIFLATYRVSPQALKDSEILKLIHLIVYISCYVGLLSASSLLISVSFRNLPVQVIACIVLAAVSAVFTDRSGRSEFKSLAIQANFSFG